MAREKTKTDQVGVRFDKDLLLYVIDSDLARSPQTALNLYEDFYLRALSITFNSKVNEPLKDILIYNIENPIDNSIFYVGRTCDDLQKRLGVHISSSKSMSTNEHPNRRRNSIIKDILTQKKYPIINLIERITPTSINEYAGHHTRENFWIAKYIIEGHSLTNRIINEVKQLIKEMKENPREKEDLNIFIPEKQPILDSYGQVLLPEILLEKESKSSNELKKQFPIEDIMFEDSPNIGMAVGYAEILNLAKSGAAKEKIEQLISANKKLTTGQKDMIRSKCN